MRLRRVLEIVTIVEWIVAGFFVAASSARGEGPDPLRPLTPVEVSARDRIRYTLLGHDPEGERAAIAARLQGQKFETPKQLERRTVSAGGREREYFLFVPERVEGKPAPVVFALHGAGASSGLAQHWKSDYTGLAAQEGFAVVYPSGVRGWNFDPTARARPNQSPPVDDLAFFDAMFDGLIAEGIADPARLYVTGGSGGGFMTWSLLFHRGHRIAAAGIMIALLPRAYVKWPPLPRPVPAILMLGTFDPLVTWEGAEGGHSAAETVKLLCQWNHCSGAPVLATLPDRDGDGNLIETATWPAAAGVKAAAPVVLYRMNGHGHGWPMTEGSSSGPKTRDFVPIEAFWSFLREHRLEP